MTTLHVQRHGVTATFVTDRPVEEFLEILRAQGWELVDVDTPFPFSETDECPCPDCRTHKETTHT